MGQLCPECRDQRLQAGAIDSSHLADVSLNQPILEQLRDGTDEIIASTRQVAEGVKSCHSLLELAHRNGVDAPIAEHVDAVVAGRMTAQEMMDAFISRDTKAETD